METGTLTLEMLSERGSSTGVLGAGFVTSNFDIFSDRKNPAARIAPSVKMASILFILDYYAKEISANLKVPRIPGTIAFGLPGTPCAAGEIQDGD